MTIAPNFALPVQRAPKVLLLQGPVGPFFKNLQRILNTECFETKRVLFHEADALFAPNQGIFRFSGNISGWENWLRTELGLNKPDAIIFFGSNRPAHLMARKVAHEFGVETISLEEGYFRSGYITCEVGGNNQYSPLRYWRASFDCTPPQRPLQIRSSFLTMCLWGPTYYLWREFTKSKIEETLYHRETRGAFIEIISWSLHLLRRLIARLVDGRKITRIRSSQSNQFILIPLQTPSDAQLQTASRGWNNEKLVEAALQALRNTGAKDTLVFKTHPLDEKSQRLVSFIKGKADTLDLRKRIVVLQSGKIGELTQHASGMIVINSTSAFSALHQNIPVLVLGDAIYRHESIVTIGDDALSIAGFLSRRASKKPGDIKAFFDAVKAQALLPGDFYSLRTQEVTALGVARKVKALILAETFLEAAQ